MASNLFNNGLYELLSGSIDYLNDTIAVLLLDNTYAYSVSQSYVSEVTGSEISGTGYERKVLASKTITLNTGSLSVNYDAANPVYTALDTSGVQVMSGIIFKSGSDDSTSPMIANIDFADLTTNGSDVELQFSASGWFAVNNVIS